MTRQAKLQPNSLRIIGGQWRGRKLRFPDVPGLRPTPDRVRETLFNWLQDAVSGERCLDLFAGSGACGLEALSRGASLVEFVDSSRAAAAAIRQHLALLNTDGGRVHCVDALRWLSARSEDKSQKNSAEFGIVFLDPPFDAELLLPACEQLERSGLLKPNARIYLESAAPLDAQRLPPAWALAKQRKAGSVYFYLCQREQT